MWEKRFPPGATCCTKPRTRSAWREFQFLFHQILAAINPPLLLQAVLQSWNQVAAALSEPSRKRRPQPESFFLRFFPPPPPPPPRISANLFIAMATRF